MSFDPKVYRNSKDGIGGPSDAAATNSTEDWTSVSLLKGVYQILGVTGVVSTPSFTDDAAFTPGATKTQPVAGTYRSVRDTVDDNDAGTLAMNAKRGLYVSPESPNGDSLVDETNDALKVIHSTADTMVGSLTETAPATDTASSGLNGRLQRIAQRLTTLLGAGATTIAKAEDAASADADVGVPAMAIRKATPANTSGTDGDYEMLQMSAGRLWVSAILEAGSALLGRAVADASAATGGIASTSRIVSAAATTNATSAKASAGRVYAIQGYNAAANVRYLKLYNKASAPTVGTDTPVKTLAIPPSVGFAFDFPLGYSFTTGIAYALTTGSADADTGAVTAGDILGLNVDYV